MKFNFVKHPGKVYPFHGQELYVDYKNGFYLYRSEIFAQTSRAFGSGYIISRQLYPIFKSSDGSTFSYWGRFGGYVGYVWSDGSRYLFGNKLDTYFLLPFVSYRGACRLESSLDIDYIQHGTPVKFESTVEDSSEDSEESTKIEPVEISLNFPCWFSPTLLGTYTPRWDASGNITIGTKEVSKDGEEKLVIGNIHDLVYIGSLPVWT